ncbi:hypothetical protein BSIN_5353 [Burkholderia singularis]|uniref:Tyr recombinase domain-containing protein n=1 Tax=Burkholderia singularis TaxID=1503053 RepID=A0A238GY99_9BURK|nr:hypothetical protein BSIN_5353 [Burkholderia singularis]
MLRNRPVPVGPPIRSTPSLTRRMHDWRRCPPICGDRHADMRCDGRAYIDPRLSTNAGAATMRPGTQTQRDRVSAVGTRLPRKHARAAIARHAREAHRLLAAICPDWMRDATIFGFATALRQANILGLEWSRVDLVQHRAWIHPDQAKAQRPIAFH